MRIATLVEVVEGKASTVTLTAATTALHSSKPSPCTLVVDEAEDSHLAARVVSRLVVKEQIPNPTGVDSLQLITLTP